MSGASNQIENRCLAVLLCSTFSEQTVISSIFYNLSVVLEGHASRFTVIFYIIVLCAAIPQSKLSDEYGRKRHLLFASYIVMLSGILIVGLIAATESFSQQMLIFLSAIPIILLAVGGNFIPIARSCIASLEIKSFRSSIGYTTAMVGFGCITVDMLSFIFLPLQIMVITLLMQFICTIMTIKYYNRREYIDRDRKIIVVIKESYKHLLKIVILTGGLSLVLTYLVTNTVFYNIYIEDDINAFPAYRKLVAISMGIAYFLGVLTQFIINPSDTKSIKFGLILSTLSIVMLLCFNNSFVLRLYVSIESLIHLKVKDILQFCFAFGFGYFVPSIFSLISKNINKKHYGWLFGLIDATDTASLLLSSVVIYLFSKTSINEITLNILNVIVLVFAVVISLIFLNIKNSRDKKLNYDL